jgi:hypothetical protein
LQGSLLKVLPATVPFGVATQWSATMRKRERTDEDKEREKEKEKEHMISQQNGDSTTFIKEHFVLCTAEAHIMHFTVEGR